MWKFSGEYIYLAVTDIYFFIVLSISLFFALTIFCLRQLCQADTRSLRPLVLMKMQMVSWIVTATPRLRSNELESSLMTSQNKNVAKNVIIIPSLPVTHFFCLRLHQSNSLNSFCKSVSLSCNTAFASHLPKTAW